MTRICLSASLVLILAAGLTGCLQSSSPTATKTVVNRPSATTAPSSLKSQQPSVSRQLNGTVIQFQNWMMELSPLAWKLELEAMRRIGMKTIVIQWLKNNRSRFFTANFEKYDPTELILKYADEHGMKVFVGVRFDEEWWEKFDRDEYLKSTVSTDLKFAKVIWDRYKQHPSFVGWYLPYEIPEDDYDDSQTQMFNSFFREQVVGLKALSSRAYKVSVSAFFKGTTNPDIVRTVFGKIFDRTGLDILLVQDGVGENGWEGLVETKVKPYLDAFAAVGKQNKFETWPIVEIFAKKTDNPKKGVMRRVPSNIGAIAEQIAYERGPDIAQKFIAFDFFHYMSPGRGEEQGALYEAYLKECLAGCPKPE